MTDAVNDNLVLVCGEAIGGKSASLAFADNPEGFLYLNCDAGKKLPFANKFQKHTIVDPYQVFEAFDAAESMSNIHTIVVDTFTFLMDMFVSVHIIGAADTMKQWGAYAEFGRNLMQQHVARSTKNVVFMAHVESILNEATMQMEKRVPVKGQLSKNGVEALTN